jgi:hypothetical protein
MRPLQSLAFSLLATSFFLSVSLLSYLDLTLFPTDTPVPTFQAATSLDHISHSSGTTLSPYLDKLFILLLPNHTLPMNEGNLTTFTLTSSSDDGDASDMMTELIHGNSHGGKNGMVE